VASLHDQAAPYFVRKLIDLRQTGDSATKSTVRSFLLGLAALKKPVFQKELQKEIVSGRGQDSDFATVIVSLLRVDPTLADNLTEIARKRIVALLKTVVADSTSGKFTRLAHPVGWLKAFVDAHGQQTTWKEYQPVVVEALIEKYSFDPGLMAVVGEDGPIHDAYFEAFEKQASSTMP